MICIFAPQSAESLPPAELRSAWANKAGGNAIATDQAGNSWVTGAGPDTTAAATVTKYDSAGNLLWTRGTVEGRAVAVDAAGNSFVAGGFAGTVSFANTVLTATGFEDLFLAKYDSEGNFLWVRQASTARGYGLATDGFGNVFLTGSFYNNLSLGGVTFTNRGQRDILIAKFDAAGTVLWSWQGGGSGDDYGTGISADAAGNIAVAGVFEGNAFFDGTSLTSAGAFDIFVARFASNRSLQWVRQAGGAGIDYANGLATDEAGHAYVIGYFRESFLLEGNSFVNRGERDILALKYDSAGHLVWARQSGGSFDDYGIGVAVGKSGTCYFTGVIQGTAVFENSSLDEARRDFDIFFAKYDPTGKLLFVQRAGSTNHDFGIGVALDGAETAYLTGNFEGTISFGTHTLSGPANSHYLLKSATARPVIHCVDPPEPVSCDNTSPSVTGLPILDSSCSPASEVQFVYSDVIDSFSDEIIREWKAIDPLCGESDICRQRIRLKTVFISTSLPPVLSYDGMVASFVVNVGGTITSSQWKFIPANGAAFFLDQAEEGVVVSRTELQIDFTIFKEGVFDPASNYSIEFSGNIKVSDTCGGIVGGSGGGLSPPLYTLSRGASATVDSTDQSATNPQLQVSCGSEQATFRSSSRWFRFQPDDDGVASITLRPEGLTPRMAALTAGSGLLQPKVKDCGRGQLYFTAQKGKVYAVVVDAGGTFKLDARLVDPVKVIDLSGNLIFGSVQVSSISETKLGVANHGNIPIAVHELKYPAGFTGDWPGGTLDPNQVQEVTVRFAPTAPTFYGGEITVRSDATAGIRSIPVSGTGTPVPTREIRLTGNLAFGNVQVGSFAEATLRIANLGNSPMPVHELKYPTGFTGDWPGGTLIPNQVQEVKIRFTPSAPTFYGGEISVRSDATSGTPSIPVSGTGTPIPTREIRLTGTLAFGNVQVGSTADATLIIANQGNSPLTIHPLTYPTGFTGNWPGGTIDPAQSREVTVTFAPTAAGAYEGTLTISSDATSGSGSVSLSGTGVDPAAEIPPRLTFTLQGDLLTISREGGSPGFKWQTSETVSGGYVDIMPSPGTSYTVNIRSGMRFFRLSK